MVAVWFAWWYLRPTYLASDQAFCFGKFSGHKSGTD